MVTREDVYCLVRSRPNVNVVGELAKRKLVAEVVGNGEVAVYFEQASQLDAIQDFCEEKGLKLRI